MLLLLAAACHRGQAGPQALQDVTWTATTINGSPVISPAPQLRFNGTTVSGNTGCNYWGRSYSVQGDTLVWKDDGSVNNKGCADANGAQESALLSALRGSVTWQIAGETLTLDSAEGEVVLTWASQRGASSAASPTPASSDAIYPLADIYEAVLRHGLEVVPHHRAWLWLSTRICDHSGRNCEDMSPELRADLQARFPRMRLTDDWQEKEAQYAQMQGPIGYPMFFGVGPVKPQGAGFAVPWGTLCSGLCSQGGTVLVERSGDGWVVTLTLSSWFA